MIGQICPQNFQCKKNTVDGKGHSDPFLISLLKLIDGYLNCIYCIYIIVQVLCKSYVTAAHVFYIYTF